MPSIYNLQEFDPYKIMSGEIDPKKVVPIKYQALPTNSAGMILVDKNTDLTYSRKLSSLYTTKTKQSKFEEVVDITFTELEPVPQITVVGGVDITKIDVIDTAINPADSTAAAGPGLIL